MGKHHIEYVGAFLMKASVKAKDTAIQALRLLGVKEILPKQDPIEMLENTKMLISCSIEFDIFETIKNMVRLLRLGKVQQARELLGKLESLLSARDWE